MLALIDRQVRALIDGHAAVLADRDPEPLHQLRVAMRRLRVTLPQFAPVLCLPADLDATVLAKTSRRIGLARDLDVLQQRLQQQLLPQLPDLELERLKPVLRQFKRERKDAQSQLQGQLKAAAYLRWLSKMQRWLRQPVVTPLAQQPLARGLVQWQLAWLAELPVHPGWDLELLVTDAQREQIHDLRKRIKAARYCLENCKSLLGRRTRADLSALKQMQELLGEINDLQVLKQAIDDQLLGSLAADLPSLQAQLLQREASCWQQWRQLAQAHGGERLGLRMLRSLQHDQRKTIVQQQVLQMCSGLQRAVLCDWQDPLAAR